GMVLDQVDDGVDAAVHCAPGIVGITGVAEIDAAGGFPMAGYVNGVLDELVNALVSGSRDGNHRDAQQFLQLVDHDSAAVGTDFVHHVEGKHHGDAQLHQLDGQIEVTLDVGGIHNV